jgi:hypothetical protein
MMYVYEVYIYTYLPLQIHLDIWKAHLMEMQISMFIWLV